MECIVALDQGTTSSRAIAFDRDGEIAAIAQREFRQIYPQPGWVEHDPREIWQTQLDVLREVIAKTGKPRAVGITNQRETTILWDRTTGEPIANAIVWQDRRTADMCERLKREGHEPLFRERTGLVLDPYFSGTKIRWLLDHVTCDPARIAFGTVDSWLVWNLTRGRVHVTDVTNASRTLLFDIRRRQWDDDLLRILGIPRAMLPEVVTTTETVGEVDPVILSEAKELGRRGPSPSSRLRMTEGIPIRGIAGDQQAALAGQRCTSAGMAKNTYGTGCFIVMNTGEEIVRSQHGLLTTIADDRNYALEGSVFVAGAAVQWLRDELHIVKRAADIEVLAASVPDSGGVTFVPAFTGLGAPHWNPHARGAITGITRGTTAAHIARAALEAIALQTADVLDAMAADFGRPVAELRVDGGASTNNLLMQIQADVARVRVVRPSITETTALGAAYLAGLPATQWKADRTFEPQSDTRELRERWRAAVLAANRQ